MVTTVTLNPHIDLTMQLPSLQAGTTHLADTVRTDVIGKGLNVSVVLRALHLPTICTGINYHGNGKQLTDHLEFHCISHRFAMAGGDLRTNVKLCDSHSGETTEILHPGTPVSACVIEDYLRLLQECAAQSRVVVFSGALPVGADNALYRRSIKAVKTLQTPVRTILDATGSPMKQALRQKPYLLKLNQHEMRTAFRCNTESLTDATAACRDLIRRGIQVVCLTMGAAGALIADRDYVYFAPPLDLAVRGTHGAGDSMIAGICRGIREDAGIDTMLRYGVAAASATLEQAGTGLCHRADFDRLLPQVTLRTLDAPPPLPLPQPPEKDASAQPAAPATPKRMAASRHAPEAKIIREGNMCNNE